MNITPYGLPFDRPVARLDEGIDVDPPAVGRRRPGRLRGPLPPPRSRRARPLAVRRHAARDLDRRARAEDARADRTQGRRLAADEDVAPAVRRRPGAIRTAAKDAGRDTEAFTPGLLGYVLLAPDEETLRAHVRAPAGAGAVRDAAAARLRQLGVEPPLGEGGGVPRLPAVDDRPRRALAVIARIPPEVVRYYAFCGTAEQVAERDPRLRPTPGCATHLLEHHRVRRPCTRRVVVQGGARQLLTSELTAGP